MAESNTVQASKPQLLYGIVIVLTFVYIIYNVIYVLFWSPLAKVPGPFLNKISRIPFAIHLRNGTTVKNTVELHAKYGPIVQLDPSSVSFTSIESAWPQIYGFRTGALKGHQSHPKDQVWFGARSFNADHVLRAHGEAHGRQRKLLSHAFSERALNAQEDLLQEYVDKLVEAIRKTSVTTGEPINIVDYYNWTTFDIIGDLLFSQSFGNLDGLRTNRHIENLLRRFEALSALYMRTHFGLLTWFNGVLTKTVNAKSGLEFLGWVEEQTNRRIALDTDRPDFMSFILQHNGDKAGALSDDEIKANAAMMIGAGSETTATLLSGVTWLLLKHPKVMRKLRNELHQRFATYKDITLHEVAKAPYLLAVLNEALRYYPPVPTGFPRTIAQGGEWVSDYYMPAGTSVCVSSFAAHHDARNFTDPDTFDPERWLGNEKYSADKLSEIQPFSFGPHSCLGKNLAYGEMRLILAKVIWSFDLETDASSEHWLEENKVFVVWKKPALLVRATEADHGR